MSLNDRLRVVLGLGIPTNDFAIGNATAAVAHGLLNPKIREIHDLDVYVSGSAFARLAQKNKVQIGHTYKGNYPGAFPVIHPTGSAEIELFRADIYPFDGCELPGERELLDSAVSHDFGADIGFLPVLSVDNLLKIKRKFGRPQDKADLEVILNTLNNQHQYYQVSSALPGNIFTQNFLYLSPFFAKHT